MNFDNAHKLQIVICRKKNEERKDDPFVEEVIVFELMGDFDPH